MSAFVKKLALFVEGLTEQLFAQRLIEAIAGRHQLIVTLQKALGGGDSGGSRRFVQLDVTKPVGNACYYVLICDSSGDTRVLSDIREQYPSLIRSGFHKILGLQDVYNPQRVATASQLRAAMAPYIPKGMVPADVLLAIVEIEAWFLAEPAHYTKIDPLLTPQAVASVLGVPADQLDAENVIHPSSTLDRVYQLAGKRYTKERRRLERTVDALDYATLYCEVTQRVNALRDLCREIDQFLT